MRRETEEFIAKMLREMAELVRKEGEMTRDVIKARESE
jgi:hypothetical protein